MNIEGLENPYKHSAFPLVQLSKKQIKICQIFANKMAKKGFSEHRKRRQFNLEKSKNDFLLGVVGEYITYNSLKNTTFNLSLPDTKIYDAYNKSWDPDLKSSQYEFAVKTYNINSSFSTISWTFQWSNRNGKGGKDKWVFKDKIPDSNFVSMVVCDLDKMNGRIASLIRLSLLHQKNMFKYPILHRLKEIKRCVYWNDLIKNNLTLSCSKKTEKIYKEVSYE